MLERDIPERGLKPLRQARLFNGGKYQASRNGSMPLLPPELINEVALHLRSTFQWRALANVNETCRVVREVTLPVLYETVVWEKDEDPVEAPWRQTKQKPGWKYTKYLFLHENSFDALQRYENSESGLPLPLDAFPRLFPQLIFIMLVADPFYISRSPLEDDVAINFRVHLYGEITPMDMVVRSCTRTANPPPRWKVPWQTVLDHWDRKPESQADQLITWYYHRAQMIALHKHARYITNDIYPLEFLQHKKSRTDPFEWEFEAQDEHGYDISPKLDLRLLNKEDQAWDETLQGVIWLLQTNSLMAGVLDDHRPGAEVDCRSEMVMPLVQTYATQKPSEFFLTVVDDISVQQFVALTHSIVDYVKSIPKITQFTHVEPRGVSFIEIRAREVDDEAETFVHRHRATFVINVDKSVQPQRAYFWVTVHAETRHEGGEGEAERVELVSFNTRHELGPYEYRQRWN
ncbi:hypothetical protein QFC21_006217 [Naganishia friedmannii]|uniref:Uncharacterized protein n=1 Tax=Naganishia friedmannii TaxID=89922 RepID=A0ACC2V489_9TREE|nr:hypothetical protein QFC21_006217 [Naganishia friedmannii]